MSDNISNMSKEFKELMDLKIHNEAQFKVIANLTKKNKELSEEVTHLKSLLDKSVPTLRPLQELSPVPNVDGDSEITICKLEIEKLREKSTREQLTYEDSKRLEIYTKILTTFRGKPKTIELTAKKLSDDELLLTLGDGKNE